MKTWLDQILPQQGRFIFLLCAFIGAAIQIQTSIGANADYEGLRINLADPVLPLAGIAILASLLRGTSRWPGWRIAGGWLWPVVMSGVMTLALLVGYRNGHVFTHWALINKYAGWFVLMAYFGLGAWLAANGGAQATRAFLAAFLATFAVIFFSEMAFLIFRNATNNAENFYGSSWQLKGLMGNRNAYALLLVFAIALLAATQNMHKITNPVFLWLTRLFWFTAPLALAYDGSRAGILAAFLVLAGIGIRFGRAGIRSIFLPFAAGLVLVSGLWALNPQLVFHEHQMNKMTYLLKTAQSGSLDYKSYKGSGARGAGDDIRLRFFRDSMALWQKAPMLGIGLGSFLRFEMEKYGAAHNGLNVIDSTPLWLLTETGLIGAAVFGGFFVFAILALRKRKGENDDTPDHEILRFGIMMGLLAFAFMALFHELLYTRCFWFALGLSLGQSPGTRPR